MIEESLQQNLFSQGTEKTFIDKLLAKEDIAAVRKIIKKKNLCREDLLEILYLLSSSEIKLLNWSEHDRYIMMKFFIWIREFVKIAELLYDYQDDLKKKSHSCMGCYKDLGECKCEVKISFVLNRRTKQFIDNNERLIEHNVKFLIDLFFNIGRSSLSLGAAGFMEILKNKYEIKYDTAPQAPIAPENKSFIQVRR